MEVNTVQYCTYVRVDSKGLDKHLENESTESY